VVAPFRGDWRPTALPNICRALAHGPRVLTGTRSAAGTETFAELTPANVRLAGIDPDTGRIVLSEMCGLAADYRLRLGERLRTGRIDPFQILETS
jgi:hypothetical protein